jgi:hypothetical protein
MPNKEEAEKAIADRNGKDLKGRPLKVNPLSRDSREVSPWRYSECPLRGQALHSRES